MNVLAGYTMFVGVVRVVLFYTGIAAAAICAIDWAVRTRRLSPFSWPARFFRARVDPLMLPVERTIVRAGGQPSAAPWWTLVAVVVGGILLVSLLDFFGGLVGEIVYGLGDPAKRIPVVLVSWSFSALRLALIVRILSSWLPISPYSRWVRWTYPLTEWMLAPLRRVIPLIGRIDISPLIAWLLLNFLQSIVLRAFGG
jgi:YggT family protein